MGRSGTLKAMTGSKRRRLPPAPAWVGDQRVASWGPLDEYDRASPAVDCVLFTAAEGQLGVLVHRRLVDPGEGQWALPGVFVNYGESFQQAALRALKTKVGLELGSELHEVGIDNHPDRDERGWVISVSYVGLLAASEVSRLDSTTSLAVVPVSAPPGDVVGAGLALDLPDDQAELVLGHNQLVGGALEWLRRQVYATGLVLELMPPEFTLRDLRLTYEAILGKTLNRASFQRQVVEVQRLIEPTGETRTDVSHRPAALYRAAAPTS